MAECHTFFVNAGDGFFQESRAGNWGWSPNCVAAILGVCESGRCWTAGSGNVEDCGWSKGKEVVGPFLCDGLANVIREREVEST